MLLGVDVGGTFTDAVLAAGGRLWTAKSPTTPEDQSEGVLNAVEAVLHRAGEAASDVTEFVHGTTAATNALLEGEGARTVFVATKGVEDIVELARRARADLYRLCEARPAPLVPPELRVGATERMTPDRPETALDVDAAVAAILDLEPEAVAACFLHAYRHPEHVRVVAELRSRGQAFELRVPLSDHLEEDFLAAHEHAYGYRDPEAEVELVTLRVTATTPGPVIDADAVGEAAEGAARSIRDTLVAQENHEPGVSWVLNDPYAGGTHLPDITVITPAFAQDALIGFAANRAHHADVGGPTPGSMPADSKPLADEGVVIGPQRLDEDAIERLAAQMRQPRQRRADVRAQLAANRTGVDRLQERHDRMPLEAAMAATIDYAERRTRAALEALTDGEYTAEDVLEAADEDLRLQLKATVREDELHLKVVEYAVRRGSGGRGEHRGGDGIVREVEALAEMDYSLLTERRRHAPPGANGGEPGAKGKHLIDGEEQPSKARGSLKAGQRLRIETPGGGGYG